MHRIVLVFVLVLVGCEEFGTILSKSAQQPVKSSVAVRPAPPAAQTPASARPGSVIVRKVSSNEIISGVRAQCARNTERLIGGGCDGLYAMRGWPFGYGATDTVGAGWECKYREHRRTAPTTAYALCQVLERSPVERGSAAPD